VPVLVLDNATRERIARSPRRAQFYGRAVTSLDAALAERGARLILRRGAPVATVKKLVRETRAEAVVWSSAYDAPGLERQRRLQTALEETGLRAVAVHDGPAVPPEDTAAARSADGGTGYRAFRAFVPVWENALRPPVSGNVTFDSAGLASEAPFEAGEFSAESDGAATDGTAEAGDAASERGARAALEAFLAGPVLQYLTARNVPGEATSRLAAHLSFGTLAARTVTAAIGERLRDRFLLSEERLSLEAFRRGLALRDFFLQLAWFFERRAGEPLQARMRGFPFAKTHPALEAWRSGRTGYPLVDAGMRELRATGWMHPRARTIAASFLCFDLGVDWRVGRDYWDRELIEDAPALAVGNWQWIAGVGADLAQFPRIYNPRKQARALDPRGAYVRRWVPELASLPAAHLAAGAPAGPRAQLSLDLFGAHAYPAPVVDHERAARAFLGRYAEFVRGLPARDRVQAAD
jgi:deoxyribodipyrimidine photo-lyase